MYNHTYIYKYTHLMHLLCRTLALNSAPHIYIYINIYVYIYIYTYIYIYVCIRVHTYVYIYMCIINIHTYKCTLCTCYAARYGVAMDSRID